MPALGLDVPKKDIDDLFTQWDADGGGEIGYNELVKILRARPAMSPAGAAAGAMAAMSKLGKK